MGLTMGTGPFGKHPAGTFNFEPDAPKHHGITLFLVPLDDPGITINAGGRHLRIDGTIPTGDPYTLIVPVTPGSNTML